MRWVDVRLVLFDLDGTLINTSASIEAQWVEWGARYGAVFTSWHRHWPSLMSFYEVPVGLRRARATLRGPQPAPRSTMTLASGGGGGASLNSVADPRSRRPGENTPASV